MANQRTPPVPESCPPIPEELVAYMKRRFPNKLTILNHGSYTEQQVGIKVGQASVVDWMEKHLKKQQDNILNLK